MSAAEDNHRLLVGFLAGEFGRQRAQACSKVTLFQAPPGSKGREIRAWNREETPELFEGLGNIERLATTMLEIAEHDSTTLPPGRYRYEVRTTQTLQGSARHAFQLIVSADEEFPGIDEQPDTRGQYGQMMRHTEWAIRSAMQMAQSVTGIQQQEIRRLAEDNHRMASERVRMINELEAARGEQEERAMSMILAERADDRKDLLLRKGLPLLPVMLSRFLGKDQAPGASVPALPAMLDSIIDSLTPQQAESLFNILDMKQQMVFMEFMRIMQEQRKAAKAKEQQEQASMHAKPEVGAPADGAPRA